jgi:Skp family chaperone for outer membrane proteins
MWTKGIIISSVIAVLAVAIAVYSYTTVPTIGYVRLKAVFDGFEMKKELEKQLRQEMQQEQQYLDSIGLILQQRAAVLDTMQGKSTVNVDHFLTDKQQYLNRRQQFETYSAEKTRQYDAQIIARMREYIKTYGTEHGYDLIITDDDNGSVLFGTPSTDITDPIITFLNTKYSGK